MKLDGFKPPNYLDDFLFVALLRRKCDNLVNLFLEICSHINFPVSEEKTVWSSTTLVFLGLLIDTINQIVSIPVDKVHRAIDLINDMLKGRKTMVGKL